jgi:NADH dehydrogenase FAD-containing subunit
VILVHNEPKILGMMSWSLPAIATKRLSDIGIDLRLNDKVVSSTDDSVSSVLEECSLKMYEQLFDRFN